MKNIPFKVFAVLALCCAVGSFAWDYRTGDDRASRAHASAERCNKVVTANERIAQVRVACARDPVVSHYDEVGVLLYAGLISFGMGAIFLGATKR